MRIAIAAVFLGGAVLLQASVARAQIVTSKGFDTNIYPQLSGDGAYNLSPAPVQTGPAGTITMTSAAPSAAYSFKDMLAHTHGYVETSVTSRGGYGVEGGVSVPIVPGKAELELGGGTGQIAGLPSLRGNGKHDTITYDSYYAGLHLHPADDLDATIAISGLRLHGPSEYAYSPFGAP